MKQALCFAVLFLTRIPVPTQWQVFDEKSKSHSLYWYAIVGGFIGALLLITSAILELTPLQNHPLIMATLLITTWTLITGGLHLDGLADAADAWLGGHGDSTKTLAIMKDVHCGVAAVIAIVLVLILKITALATLMEHQQLGWLLFAPIIARGFAMLLFTCTPYVRENGIGSSFKNDNNSVNNVAIYWQMAGWATVMCILFGTQALIVLCVCFILFMGLRHLMKQRIGGTTGDTAGAVIELLEVATLIAALPSSSIIA